MCFLVCLKTYTTKIGDKMDTTMRYDVGAQVFWVRADLDEPRPITIVGDDGGGIVDFVQGHHTVFSTARGNVAVTP